MITPQEDFKRMVEENEIVEFEGTDLNLEQLQADFDAQGMIDEITKKLGVTSTGLDLKVQIMYRESRRGEPFYVNVMSGNIIGQCGFMKEVMTDVRITNFGGSIGKGDEGVIAWIPISFHYETGRGSNGLSWFTAWYDFGTKIWTFKGEGE